MGTICGKKIKHTEVYNPTPVIQEEKKTSSQKVVEQNKESVEASEKEVSPKTTQNIPNPEIAPEDVNDRKEFQKQNSLANTILQELTINNINEINVHGVNFNSENLDSKKAHKKSSDEFKVSDFNTNHDLHHDSYSTHDPTGVVRTQEHDSGAKANHDVVNNIIETEKKDEETKFGVCSQSQQALDATEDNKNSPNKNPKIQPLYSRTSFVLGEHLNFLEDVDTEYKQYSYPFKDAEMYTIKKTICSFLNYRGGRIYIGIKDDDYAVVGIKLPPANIDKLKRIIDDLVLKFKPKVESSMCKVYIVGIKNQSMEMIPGLYVVKIVVKPGKSKELFFTDDEECFIRRDAKVERIKAFDLQAEFMKRQSKNVPDEDNLQNTEEDPPPSPIDLGHLSFLPKTKRFGNKFGMVLKEAFNPRKGVDVKSIELKSLFISKFSNCSWDEFIKSIDEMIEDLFEILDLTRRPQKIIPKYKTYVLLEFQNEEDADCAHALIKILIKYGKNFQNINRIQYSQKKKFNELKTTSVI